MNKKLSLNEIADLRHKCIIWQLKGSHILRKYTDEQLQEIVNGIGAAAMPDGIVSGLNMLCPTLMPVAMIHDVDWHESDGIWQTFYQSNERFRENAYIAADYNFGWWNPRRYAVRKTGGAFADICHTCGYYFYLQCRDNSSK